MIDGLVRAHEGYLRRVLFQRRVRPCDVDDELQQVWEVLVRKVSHLPENRRKWLLAVAINGTGNYYKERRRESRLVAGVEDEECDGKPDPEQVLMGAEVAHLVDGLDPALRAVIVGSIGGETIGEMSARLGIPEGTVSSRLCRARAQIRTALCRYSS